MSILIVTLAIANYFSGAQCMTMTATAPEIAEGARTRVAYLPRPGALSKTHSGEVAIIGVEFDAGFKCNVFRMPRSPTEIPDAAFFFEIDYRREP